jgi:hypothetical protein
VERELDLTRLKGKARHLADDVAKRQTCAAPDKKRDFGAGKKVVLDECEIVH